MSQLKFEKVGHSVYVLASDMVIGRLKQRFDETTYFEPLQPQYPFSHEQLFEIVGKLRSMQGSA